MSSASLERYFQAVLDSRTASVPEQQDLDLEELLKPDNVWECIKDDPETQQALLPLLPEGTQTLAGLREMVYSAQYRQTVQTLALVIQNGDAGPLLAEMRLPLDAQGPDNGITRFLTVCASSHHRSSVCICVSASALTPRTHTFSAGTHAQVQRCRVTGSLRIPPLKSPTYPVPHSPNATQARTQVSLNKTVQGECGKKGGAGLSL